MRWRARARKRKYSTKREASTRFKEIKMKGKRAVKREEMYGVKKGAGGEISESARSRISFCTGNQVVPSF